jgi:hypothetical protein
MGFDNDGIRFLLAARASGVSFNKVATIGRQILHVDFDSLKKNLEFFNIQKNDIEIERILSEGNGYAEPFLKTLGAEEICSIDVSPFEGASFIHDMNLPVPHNLKNAFTAVIDGGSLEHIFDFPRAIKNCMEMVQAEGHFLGITPANNFMGHGLYQFSPELYFCLLTEDNGFRIERIILFESILEGKWYEVRNPEKTRKRITLTNGLPTYLLIQAKKIERVPILSFPQQGYYVALWDDHGHLSKSFKDTANNRGRLHQIR